MTKLQYLTRPFIMSTKLEIGRQYSYTTTSNWLYVSEYLDGKFVKKTYRFAYALWMKHGKHTSSSSYIKTIK